MAAGPPAPVAPYLRPASLDEALRALAGGERLIVAGGTDVYPASATRPLDRPVLDISALPDLRRVRLEGGAWRIGALATWTDVAQADGLPAAFDGLRAAARTIGGRQIQNAGTVAGNVVNASPAADGIPNLLALEAEVELASVGGVRRVALESFLTGYRATARRPDELVTAILVPAPEPGREARSAFRKLGARAYLVISIVAVGVVLETADRRVVRAGVAVGACSPVARRLRGLEAALLGRRLAPGLGDAATSDHLAGLAPIDDVRATAAYRRDAALTLVRRALEDAAR